MKSGENARQERGRGRRGIEEERARKGVGKMQERSRKEAKRRRKILFGPPAVAGAWGCRGGEIAVHRGEEQPFWIFTI